MSFGISSIPTERSKPLLFSLADKESAAQTTLTKSCTAESLGKPDTRPEYPRS